MNEESKTKSWSIRMKCVVYKDVFVEGCSREEAANNPWDYCVEEAEVSQEDWEVLGIYPNE